jgi:transcriptional regulator with XRE-family HTH domain
MRKWDVPCRLQEVGDMEKPIYTREQRILLKLLRDLRSEAGLRQSDVAAQLHRPQSFISKCEAGERRLDVLELRQLCSVLGISLSDFVNQLEKRLRAR